MQVGAAQGSDQGPRCQAQGARGLSSAHTHLRVEFEDGPAQRPHRGGGKRAQAHRVCRRGRRQPGALVRWQAAAGPASPTMHARRKHYARMCKASGRAPPTRGCVLQRRLQPARRRHLKPAVRLQHQLPGGRGQGAERAAAERAAGSGAVAQGELPACSAGMHSLQEQARWLPAALACAAPRRRHWVPRRLSCGSSAPHLQPPPAAGIGRATLRQCRPCSACARGAERSALQTACCVPAGATPTHHGLVHLAQRRAGAAAEQLHHMQRLHRLQVVACGEAAQVRCMWALNL